MTSPAITGEGALRGLVRAATGLTVLTGGQTGVDTYAAVAGHACRLGRSSRLPPRLPAGGRPLSDARRRRLRGAILHELSSPSFRYRTWTCAYLADAVLLLDPAGGAGCRETARAATRLGRPLLTARSGALAEAQTADWLAGVGPRVLMVAGCRASVLASKGKGRGLHTELAAIMAGARQYHDGLIAERDQRLS